MPPADPGHQTLIPRSHLVQVTALTTFGMTAIAVVIFWLRGIDLATLAAGRMPWLRQIALGAVCGTCTAGVVTLVVLKAGFFAGVRDISRGMLELIRPTFAGTVALSLAAGWSEEILFRGALQPWLGFWAASTLFALAHIIMPGRGWDAVKYAAVVFVVGLGLGILFHHAGLAAAMTAHAMYDLVALNLARHLFFRKE